MAPEMANPHADRSGSADLKPSDDFFNSSSGLNRWIVSHLHIIILVSVAAYFIGRKLYAWYLDRRSRNLAAREPTFSDTQVEEKLRAARERQFLASREAMKRDAQLKEQQRLEALAEKERKMKAAQARSAEQGNDDDAGNRLGFSEKLPSLPSGNNYRPLSSNNGGGGGGGGYRPTGFSRPKRGG